MGKYLHSSRADSDITDSMYGCRSFYAVVTVWISLPDELRNSDSLKFKNAPKLIKLERQLKAK